MTGVPVDVLWTAGWDSTFRVADLLLRHRCTVQPWYVLDSWRRSTPVEIRTQAAIRAALSDMDAAMADQLLPTRFVRIEDIPADAVIAAQFQSLLGKSFLGSQYNWLARLAKSEEVMLELSIHRDDRAHGFLCDDVELTEDGVYRLVDTPSDPALEVFRRFRFPLFDSTKLEMERAAKASGFSAIMEMTWFCFNPLPGGKPCGHCNPCKYTQAEGLGRRVPAGGRFVTGVQSRALDLLWRIGRTIDTRRISERQSPQTRRGR
jgi:hypothetical protein